MKAWILDESPGDYRFGVIDDPVVGPGDVRVRVVASALNHMDLWLTKGLPKPPVPHVPGCDSAGVVDAIGDGVDRARFTLREGDEGVVNPSVSCRRCSWCLAGDSPLCDSFQIVGEHRWGAHGSYVVVPAENVVPKPPGRSWDDAAAYGLAGVTAWRMLQRARLKAGETLLVVGVGGGVSAMGLGLGVAMGARVFVTSRDATKRDAAIAMGAEAAFDSDSAEPWPVKADVVFENVGPATWERSVRALRKGGRLVTCGGTSGPKVEVSLPRLFFGQFEIIGSTMGSYREFDEVTGLVERGLPVPVDAVVEGLDAYPEALERLRAGVQLGKVVVRH
jgi:NADPH:quinone reductase-like Zn-dependent oxidoreductase